MRTTNAFGALLARAGTTAAAAFLVIAAPAYGYWRRSLTPGRERATDSDQRTPSPSVDVLGRDEGADARYAVAVIDRQQGGHEHLAKHGLEFSAVFTASELERVRP